MQWETVVTAIRDGSYCAQTVADLREMLQACMEIQASNPVVLRRADHAAEIIRGELASRFISGEPVWQALQRAVAELAAQVPNDHDVLLQVSDVSVVNAEFVAPHTFLFSGRNSSGLQVTLVIHFSKLDACVVNLPKVGPNRIITGFRPMKSVL